MFYLPSEIVYKDKTIYTLYSDMFKILVFIALSPRSSELLYNPHFRGIVEWLLISTRIIDFDYIVPIDLISIDS